MKATIVIPNYNGKAFMEDCLTALAEQTIRDFEVLVVDNGSVDGSAEGLDAWFPGVKVICFDKNYGFSRAVNEGIRQSGSDYVILLNNDTIPFPDYVEKLIGAIEADERIFSVSPKMIQACNRHLLDDAGDSYCALGWAFQRGVGQSVDKYSKPGRIFSACAGAAIYRRAVFDEIGVFDELHFAYLEDIDVGYRALIHGYQNRYEPEAKVYHVGSGTSGSRYNAFKVKLSARNSVYLNYKNMPLPFLILNWLPLMLGWLVKLRFFVNMGFGDEYKAGLKEGFVTRKNCRKVPFVWSRLGNYLYIEWLLIVNTVIYAAEFLKRRLKK
ncbi:MAG: glycosyltransferase family 2 protein [Lachnospiraceae bacterium]|nr:glycosyltransferase family 2 protein [Lachnospiraceae bacterium]